MTKDKETYERTLIYQRVDYCKVKKQEYIYTHLYERGLDLFDSKDKFE